MVAPAQTVVSADQIAELLQQPTTEHQAVYLRGAGLLNEEALSHLLDQAMRLARGDPGQARQLAVLCAAVAQLAEAPALYPRALYLQAQTHAANGEFEQARDLIQTARHAYLALGDEIEALRTNIGLMNVLNELGQHPAALQAGQAVLDGLSGQARTHPRAPLLAALAHQNRGVVFETTGRYDEALASYTQAAELFAQLGQTDRLGDLHNNRGIVLVHLGRISEALAAFEAAAAIYAEAELPMLHGQALSNQGDALLAIGRYASALEVYEQARRLFEPLDAVAHRRILLRKVADAYLALNLYPEALDAYREALDLLREAGMADHYARAAWGMGAALLAEGETLAAAGPLGEAAQRFADAGNTPMLSTVMLEQSAQRHARGEAASALDLALSALDLVRPNAAGATEWPVQAAYAGLRVADLLLPNAAAAEPYLEEARRYADTLNLPAINYRLNGRLGRLHLLQGNTDLARERLETAVAQIEDLRGNLSNEALRTSFLRDKHSPYADLLRLHLDRSANGNQPEVEAAFLVAERAKSRALLETLAGLTRASASTPAPQADLAALQADLDATYDRFLEPGDATLADLQARATHLEREISRLSLRPTEPASTNDHAPALNPLAQVLAPGWLNDHLPADLPLVAYHILDEEILAFVRGADGLRVIRRVSRVGAVRHLLQQLGAQWDRFRAGPEFAQRHRETLEKSAQRILAALYGELIAPLEAALERAAPGERLAIIPHGLLHQVPFPALYGWGSYLIDRYEITYSPSAAVLALGHALPRSAPRRALVMGVADELIPAVTAEARAVAGVLESAGLGVELAVGDTATPAEFAEHAPGSDLIHLACHGLFRADNPMFSSLRLHAGWLSAAAAAGYHLPNSLVALSACESGRARVVAGDEAIGLPRAFLSAGAASVLVSLWLVQDETTSILMADWYRRLTSAEGSRPAAALRAAQQALRLEHSHPYFWAPFVLMGQG